MKHYETVGGQVTRGETLAKLNETLIEAEELAALLSHLHNTENNDADKLMAKGWLGVSGLMRKVRFQVIELAKGKLQ